MHLEKPELRKILEDPSLSGYQVLVKLFFTPERVEPGGRPGVRDAARGTHPGSGACVWPEGRAGPDRRVSCVGAR